MSKDKLREAIDLSAFLINADNAGYLTTEEQDVVLRNRFAYGALCERISLNYLKRHQHELAAKSALMGDIARIRSADHHPDYEIDHQVIFSSFENEIGEIFDRQCAKGPLARVFSDFLLSVPNLARFAFWAMFAAVAIFVLWDTFR